MKLNYSLLSKYRSVLFGAAICLIMAFHFAEDSIKYQNARGLLYAIFNQAVIGVEIFLFLSGMGLYFSFKKNGNLLQFYKKRLVRVIVPVLLVLPFFWFISDLVIKKQTAADFWFDLSFCSLFAEGNKQFWFIAAILFFYLLFPLLFWFFELPNSLEPKKRELVNFLQMLLLSGFTILVVELLNVFAHEIYSNFAEITLTRFISFIFGVYAGHLVYEKKRVSVWFITAMVIACLLKIYFTVTMPFVRLRYLDAVFAVALCYFVSLLFDVINKEKLCGFFTFFGSMSLELYLIHVSLRSICKIKMNFPTYYIVNYAIIIGFSILYAWVIKLAADKISGALLKPKALRLKK